jgi:TPR repeat protein
MTATIARAAITTPLLTRCSLALFTFLSVALIQQPTFAADFDLSLKAYNRGEFQRARKDFSELADGGHAGAQFYLGEIYEGGVGVAADQKTASDWYRKSAEQNHSIAQRRLAAMYMQGRGVLADSRLGFTWYERAAQGGDVLAQYHLGGLYAMGKGTKADPVKAYMWWTVAASYGDPDAIYKRAEIVDALSNEQIDKAATLARDWETAWERAKRRSRVNPGTP